MKVEDVAIHDLNMSLQTRADLCPDTVREYRLAVMEDKKLPAVVVFEVEGGERFLADGYHRVQGRMDAGFETIEAEIHEGTWAEALAFALAANAHHGLRRSRADLEKACTMAFENREALGLGAVPTARAIAGLVGCSPTTAAGHLSKLDTWREAAERTGADGKSYPVKEKKKGSGKTSGPVVESQGLSAEYEWNENGICVNAMAVEVPIPRKFAGKIVMEVAERPDGKWVTGYDVDVPAVCMMSAHPYAPDTMAFERPEEAVNDCWWRLVMPKFRNVLSVQAVLLKALEQVQFVEVGGQVLAEIRGKVAERAPVVEDSPPDDDEDDEDGDGDALPAGGEQVDDFSDLRADAARLGAKAELMQRWINANGEYIEAVQECMLERFPSVALSPHDVFGLWYETRELLVEV